MANEYGSPDYAELAVGSLRSIQAGRLATGDQELAAAGVYAVTYALLDLAQAIRGRGPA